MGSWRTILTTVSIIGALARFGVAAGPQDASRLQYVISIQPAASLDGIPIECRITQLPPGKHSFVVLRNYGAASNLDLIAGLKFRAGVEELETRPNDERGWAINHPGGDLVIQYTVRTDPAAHGLTFDEPGGGEMPTLSNDLAFLSGSLCFVRPVSLELSGPISIAWELPAGWNAVSPWGVGAGATYAPNLQALWRNYYVAFRNGSVAERSIGDFKFAVVWCGPDDINAHTQFLDNVGQVFDSANALFGGKPTKQRYTLIVRDTAPMGTFEASPAGDSIQFNVPHGSSVDELAGRERSAGGNIFLTTLAHEYFHTWGIEEVSDEKDEAPGRQEAEAGGAMRWFGEGFTEYFARLIMLRAGLIDINDFLNEMQEMSTQAQRENASRNLSLLAASERFFDSPISRGYCYHEGCVLAFKLDLELRKTGDGRTLTGFMRRFIPLQDDDRNSVKQFVRAWEDFAPSSLRDIYPYIEQSKLIDLAPMLADIGAQSDERTRLTFDSRAQECDGAVCFEHVGPFAASQGLRDGDRVVKVDGNAVGSVGDFYRSLGPEPTPVTVERSGGAVEMTLALMQERIVNWTAPANCILAGLSERE